MTESYPWYQSVGPDDNTLLQGDLLEGVGLPVMPPDSDDLDATGDDSIVSAEVRYRNIIVLSQSCDLENGKLEFVLVAPYWPLEEAKQRYPHLESSEKRESLRQGLQVGLHPLNESDTGEHVSDFLVVDFRSVFTIPLGYAIRRASQPVARLRLLPPYREHLAQAYARFIMRIGLPVDIPKLP